MEIAVTKRITLDNSPICMSWYPLYDLSEALCVMCMDVRIFFYNNFFKIGSFFSNS